MPPTGPPARYPASAGLRPRAKMPTSGARAQNKRQQRACWLFTRGTAACLKKTPQTESCGSRSKAPQPLTASCLGRGARAAQAPPLYRLSRKKKRDACPHRKVERKRACLNGRNRADRAHRPQHGKVPARAHSCMRHGHGGLPGNATGAFACNAAQPALPLPPCARLLPTGPPQGSSLASATAPSGMLWPLARPALLNGTGSAAPRAKTRPSRRRAREASTRSTVLRRRSPWRPPPRARATPRTLSANGASAPGMPFFTWGADGLSHISICG